MSQPTRLTDSPVGAGTLRWLSRAHYATFGEALPAALAEELGRLERRLRA